MELVSFSSIILKLIMISLPCKRLLILHYLTNVHMYFLFIFVDNILVLFHIIGRTRYFYSAYRETGCRRPRLVMKKCCNFFKNCYFYSVQTGSKRQFNLKHADINFVNLN